MYEGRCTDTVLEGGAARAVETSAESNTQDGRWREACQVRVGAALTRLCLTFVLGLAPCRLDDAFGDEQGEYHQGAIGASLEIKRAEEHVGAEEVDGLVDDVNVLCEIGRDGRGKRRGDTYEGKAHITI